MNAFLASRMRHRSILKSFRELIVRHRYLLILFGIQLVFFLLNYRIGHFYADVDITLVELHPSQELWKRFSLWQANRGFGLELGADAGWVIPTAIFSILSGLGFQPLDINLISNFLFYISPALVAYLLAYSFFYERHDREKIGFFSGIFTSTSFSFYILAGFPLLPDRWPIIVIPAMAAVLLLLLQTGHKSLWILFVIMCYLNLASFIGVGFSVVPMLFATSLIGYFLLCESKNRKRDLLTVLFAGIIYMLISLPMIFADYHLSFQSSVFKSLFLSSYSSGVFYLNLSNLDFSSLLYGLPLTGRLAHPFYSLFTYNPLFVTASFLLPLAAFGSLVLTGQKAVRRKLLFLVAISLVLLFFMKGVRPPLGQFFLWLINNAQVFTLFRTPYDKIATTLVYPMSMAAAYAIIKVTGSLKRDASTMSATKVVAVIFLLALVMNAYPQYAGEISYPLGFFQLPNYYNNAASYVDSSHSSFKILGLPETSYVNCYKWGYCGVALDGVNYNKPVIHYSYVGSDVYDERMILGILSEVGFNTAQNIAIMNWGGSPSIFPNTPNNISINIDRVRYWNYLLQTSNVGQLELRRDAVGPLPYNLTATDWWRYRQLFKTLVGLGTITNMTQIGNLTLSDVVNTRPLIYASSISDVFATNNYDVFLNPYSTDSRLHILSSLFGYNPEIAFVSSPESSFNVANVSITDYNNTYVYAPLLESEYKNQVQGDLNIATSDLIRNARHINDLLRLKSILDAYPRGTYVDFMQHKGNYTVLMRIPQLLIPSVVGKRLYFNNQTIVINETQPVGNDWLKLGSLPLDSGLLAINAQDITGIASVCAYSPRDIQAFLERANAPQNANISTGRDSWYFVERFQNNSWGIRPYYGGEFKYNDICRLAGDKNLDADFRQTVMREFGLTQLAFPSEPMALLSNTQRSGAPMPRLDFKQVNPNEYLVAVNGASNPFHLNFLESFDPNWHLYLVPPRNISAVGNSFLDGYEMRVLEGNPVSTTSHALLNGFANSWYIDPQDFNRNQLVGRESNGTYDFTLLVYFQPESYFVLLSAISAATGLLAVVIVLRRHLIRLAKRSILRR